MKFVIEKQTDDGSFTKVEEDAEDIVALLNDKVGQVDRMVRQDWGYVVYDTSGKRYQVEVQPEVKET